MNPGPLTLSCLGIPGQPASMASLREMLLRLRPVGAPGAASAVGVAVDHRACAERELEPIFAAMVAVHEQCRMIGDAATAQAAMIAAQADDRVRAIVQKAQLDAPIERSAIAAAHRAQVDSDVAEQLAQARQEAELIRDRAEARLQEQVASVLARVRRDLDELTRPESTP